MQLGLVVHHDLNLLVALVEGVAHGGILCGGVLVEGDVLAAGLLHVLSAGHQRLDVETGAGDGQQAHGSQHREAATDVVGDDERLVALLVGARAGSATLGIGHGHNDVLGCLLAHLGLALLLQQAEGEGGLSRSTRLRDVDDAKLLILQVLGHLREVVLADVVAGKEDDGVLLVLDKPCEGIAEGFDDGAGAEVAAADAGHHHHLALLAQGIGHGLYFVNEFGRDARRQVQPS